MKITHKAAMALRFIVEFKRKNDGVSPSHREISSAIGYANGHPANIGNILTYLENHGLIVLKGERRSNRCIMVVGGKWTMDYAVWEDKIKEGNGATEDA